MTITPKPVWFKDVEAHPENDAVTLSFTPVMGPTHRISLPFHELKAFYDAIGRTLEENPPARRRRQWEFPRVLG